MDHYMPDGKSETLIQYVKKMRQDYPDFEVGDKLLSKEARKLFKHNIKVMPKIKGAKLEVKEIREAKNDITHFTLESNKLKIEWYEGEPFKGNSKSKIKNHHYISEPIIWKK